MNYARLKKPLMTWLPFLALIVFALCALAYLALALTASAVGQVVAALCLLAALVIVVGRFNPLTKKARRGDTEGSLLLADVVGYEKMLEPFRRIQVVETARRQFAIDAAWAIGGDSLVAVLTPRATRMMGREYRVAVDLVANGHVYRAGFLPASIDVELDSLLQPFVSRGRFFEVPVTVSGAEKPFTVTVELGEIPADHPKTP